jgi:hypothetical protein
MIHRIRRKIFRIYARKNVEQGLEKLDDLSSDDLSHIHLTCSSDYEGGGSQLFRRLSTIVFCRHFGLTYIHTPLNNVAHQPRGDEKWVSKWESYLNLGSFQTKKLEEEPTFEVLDRSYKIFRKISDTHSAVQPHFFQVKHCHFLTDRNPDLYHPFRKPLQKAWQRNGREKNLLYDEEVLNVAIHVRRGDVSAKTPVRFTPGKKLDDVITRLRSCLGNRDHKIWIFSVSDEPDLKALEEDGAELVSTLSIFDVFDHLISADILAASKSSVGYLPAVIGNGIVLYEPFWHQPISHWLNAESDFQPELTRLLQNR